MMSVDVQESVVRVTSADPDNHSFGTGFVIGHDPDGDHAYVVTCAHVVRDVDRPPLVESRPAEVVAIGAAERVDLAVLQVAGLAHMPPLGLQQLDTADLTVVITGWSRYGNEPRLLPIYGTLDRKAILPGLQPDQRVDAWALKIPDDYPLAPGYSGAPVVDRASGNVVGVATTAEGSGERGMALSIAALALIWSNTPAFAPALPPSDEVDARIPSIYLAAHPKLQAAADTRPGEHLIDLMPFFSQGDPPPSVWEQQIISRLEQQLVALRTTRQNTIHLRAFARNSASLAFGFVFSKKAGVQIVYTDNYNAVWDTNGDHDGRSPLTRSDGTVVRDTAPVLSPAALRQGLTDALDEAELYDLCFDMGIDYENLPGSGKSSKVRELIRYCQRHSRYDELVETYQRLRPTPPPTAHDLIIELAITQPAQQVQAAVDDWLTRDKPAAHKRILLALDDSRTITPAEGFAIAEQICAIVKQERIAQRTTHMLGAMPLGVALLIGWSLQSVGKIQSYELDRDGRYRPTCLIRAF
ncbi:MAG: SAVED domain-containing protein [Chloroflexales bacterium]|nr:SAVED domain-containing protein [Chloroflexales bacterium]